MTIKMKNLIFLFLLSIFVGYASCQCGCTPKMLMKRGQDKLKMGDMVLDRDDIALIKGFKYFDTNIKKWPKGEVLYTFGESFPEKRKSIVLEALGDLQNDLKGCIKFIQSTNGHHIEVTSHKGKGCYANVGYSKGSKQEVNLVGSFCLAVRGTIKHEFMHSLGFLHTHMRRDRDNYITINWDNIQTDNCYNFHICHGCATDTPYETTSVMHYGSSAFSCKTGVKSMLKKDGGIINPNIATTENDLQMIRNAYKC